jgi:hypothetical protein
MATIVNARDVILQAAGTRVLPAALPSNYTLDFSQVNGTTKPANNADVTLSAVNSTLVVTGGGITLSGGGAIKGGQTAYNTGTGFFLGFSGTKYKFSIGDASSNFLTWDGTGLAIAGSISGASSIDITGTAKFGGATSQSGFTWAGVFNASGASNGGVVAFAAANYAINGNGTANGATGVWGAGTGSTSNGVLGTGDSGKGVYGFTTNVSNGFGVHGQSQASAGAGVKAENIGSGKGLQVIGPMTIDNNTLVSNLNANFINGNSISNSTGTGSATATFVNTNKPGANSSNVWVLMNIGGTTIYVPGWT